MTSHRKILEGIKFKSHRGFIARWLRTRGEVTFSTQDQPLERRMEGRRRVRLQSGKALDFNGRFLADFMFVNQCGSGARLSLSQRTRLPNRLWVFDDSREKCKTAELVWQNGRLAGIRYLPENPPIDDRVLRRYKEKYYAL